MRVAILGLRHLKSGIALKAELQQGAELHRLNDIPAWNDSVSITVLPEESRPALLEKEGYLSLALEACSGVILAQYQLYAGKSR
jgi:hypothetical protein